MRNLFLVVALFLAFAFHGCSKKGNEQMPLNQNVILKISVLKSGEICVDNKTVTLDALDTFLAENAKKNGVVWYYREAGKEEPPAQAMETMKLVAKHQRPISMSSKPDFSDTIDENGNSRPRKN
jgi:biopolymer transport protein ExbD